MNRWIWQTSGFVFLLVGSILGAWVWASETIEIATYVPAPGTSGGSNFDRLHANRATIGSPYSLANPAEPNPPDGTLLVAQSVGIGTTTPAAQLDIEADRNGPQRAIRLRNTNAGTGAYTEMEFGNDAAASALAIGIGSSVNSAYPDTAYVVNRRNGPLTFHTNNTEKVRITAAGNVGIGTTAPAFPLEVNGNWATRGDRSYLLGADNSTWYWVMVGGTTEGTDNAVGFKANARQMRFGPGWTCTNCSDLRLKKEVTPVSNALERVLTIRGVNFRWADPKLGKKLQMGVIGQEVERVFPELVSTDSNGMKWVEPAPLTAVLIEAVRELKGQNDTLRLEVKDLKQEIESLRNVSGKERAGGGPS